MYSHEQLVEMRRKRKSPLQEFASEAVPAVGSAVAQQYAKQKMGEAAAQSMLGTAGTAAAGPIGAMGAMYASKLLGFNQGTMNAKSNYLSPRILQVFEDAMAMGLTPAEVKDPTRRRQYEEYLKSMMPRKYKQGTKGAGACPQCGMQYANDGMSGVKCLKCGMAKVAKYGYGTKEVAEYGYGTRSAGPLMKY